MDYAEKLIRGISNPQWIDAEGRPSGELFKFDESSIIEGFSETSINWYDDEYALEYILNQRKKDGDAIQFKAGAAIIPRADLDFLINRPLYEGLIGYNRNALPDNKYHGNILRKTDLPKPTRQVISQSIAMCVESIKTRDCK